MYSGTTLPRLLTGDALTCEVCGWDAARILLWVRARGLVCSSCFNDLEAIV